MKQVRLHTYASSVDSLSRSEFVSLSRVRKCRNYSDHAPFQPRPPPRVLALALFTVALPRARPTPRPRVPLDLNIGAFLIG
jgi:hypothetical protein